MANMRLRETILAVVDNQLRDNDPPCTRRAYERLRKAGYSRKEAKEKLAAVVLEEIYDVMSQNQPFDEERFERALDDMVQRCIDYEDDSGLPSGWDEIADLMDCSVGVIINRLNYTRKYFKKAIENAWEECGESTEGCDTFSVEAVCLALRKWGVEHCLGITSAQNIYYNICKALELHGHSISLSGKEFAGVKKTVVYYKADDWNPIQEEIIAHEKKKRLDKKIAVCLAGAAVVLAIVAVVIAVVANRPEKKKPSSEKPKVTEEQKSSKKEEQKQEDTDTKDPEDQTNGTVDEPVSEPTETDYIFPNSGTTELTREEVQGHTKEELRIARNEIYARHGAIFGVDDLDAYFQSKSWYTPTLSISELLDTVELSMVEENNISLISEIESGM